MRARAIIGQVLGKMISLHVIGDELMYYPSTMYKERQCIATAPTYYGEHSGRTESDVIEI